jgi:hypothetical protein
MNTAPVQPPPERDVPPAVLAITEAQLVALVGRRRRSRWLVPVAAAAAVVAVVALGAGAIKLGAAAGDLTHPAHPATSVSGLPASPQPSRTRTPPADPGSTTHPRVAGLTEAQGDLLAARCMAPGHRTGKAPRNPKLYYILGSPRHGTALVYAENGLGTCEFKGASIGSSSGHDYPEADAPELDWIPGPYAIDDLEGADASVPGGPYTLIGGRTRPDVRRIEITRDGASATVDVVNGTFLVKLPVDSGGILPDLTVRNVVRLFGQNGMEIRQPAAAGTSCMIVPGKKPLEIGNGDIYAKSCLPAVRWR